MITLNYYMENFNLKKVHVAKAYKFDIVDVYMIFI